MKVSQEGLKLIRSHEGFSPKPYKCSAGKWTIGYGSRFIDGKEVTESTPNIGPIMADRIMKQDINRFSVDIESSLTRRPTQHQFDAIASLAYNVGISAFEDSTLVKKFNSGDTLGAAMEFQRWSLVNGERSLGLLRRRLKEAQLFLED